MYMVEAVDAYFALVRPAPFLAESGGGPCGEPHSKKVGDVACRAALGDRSAQNDLASHYYAMLIGNVLPILRSHDLAADAVQTVFLKLASGDFKALAPKFHANGHTVTLVLNRAVKNVALDMLKKKSSQELSGGGKVGLEPSADAPGGIDPEAYQSGALSAGETELVHNALRRARDTAKLSPQEGQFVDTLLKVGYFSGSPDAPKIKEIAAQIWPEKTSGAASTAATRAKDRFLKQLCLDPELKQFRVGSSSYFSKNFEPLCAKVKEDVDPVVVTAVRLGLVENITYPDRDKAYEEVLRWVCSAMRR